MPLLSMTVERSPAIVPQDAVTVVAFSDKPVRILWIRRDGSLVAQETVTPPKAR